jgi:hypothetical protein
MGTAIFQRKRYGGIDVDNNLDCFGGNETLFLKKSFTDCIFRKTLPVLWKKDDSAFFVILHALMAFSREKAIAEWREIVSPFIEPLRKENDSETTQPHDVHHIDHIYDRCLNIVNGVFSE